MHKGPYSELGRSYAKIVQYLHDHEYEASIPTREIYHKGPGMIFKGNPRNYLTKIQFFLQEKPEDKTADQERRGNGGRESVPPMSKCKAADKGEKKLATDGH
jgi:hypothetical protein